MLIEKVSLEKCEVDILLPNEGTDIKFKLRSFVSLSEQSSPTVTCYIGILEVEPVKKYSKANNTNLKATSFYKDHSSLAVRLA